MEIDEGLGSAIFNLDLLESLYAQYLKDPKSISADWCSVFANLAEAPGQVSLQADAQDKEVDRDLRIYHLVQAYRTHGHLKVHINPIEAHQHVEHPELSLKKLGFNSDELTHSFPTLGLLPESSASLEKIVQTLEAIYCNRVGIEYMGCRDEVFERWVQEHIEPTRFTANLSMEEKQLILKYLNKSELFESFLHTKFVGQKRFSLEGGETLIPILAEIIDQGVELGGIEYLIGMAHRGRLNVLTNILNKSYTDVFSEFEEGYIPNSYEGSGDVKYHKGFEAEITTSGRKVRIALTPNPSHLESVYPVVEGQARARQDLLDDEERLKVIPIVIHGDASIAGQGVVYETLQFGELSGYATGGTIHIVINNQIGFTTLPADGRSTRYCTDIAHAFGAPVFHVNAEDPEASIYVAHLAIEIRQKFHCDVFIDLNCYRKYGHNEGDEPAFTQPLEYAIIRKKRPIREIYRDSLIQQGFVEKELAERLEVEFKEALQQAMTTKKLDGTKNKSGENKLPMHPNNSSLFAPVDTSVSTAILQDLTKRLCDIPENFNIHSKLRHLVKERSEMVGKGESVKKIDWGMSENLAYATLLFEGISVRLSGQDCCRGTFSHRHAMWKDQVNEKVYYPLQHLRPGEEHQQGRFEVYNSPLSEYGILGFEFGYSLSSKETLVVWEAQFGDFCNGGQIIIDQYIATSEQKWGKKSKLVLLLPHGYEGQGPEHSSARIERFLALAGNDNMQIVNPTTPAQLFHLLRRQMLSSIHKPIIVFTPKGLLRHPECTSVIEDFTEGSFQEIIDDASASVDAKKLLLCCGRIYYDLLAERKAMGATDIAIVRIEQLYPLHMKKLCAIIERYTALKECFWVQEEPSNMGAWEFIRLLINEALPEGAEVRYVGRARSASPAVGSYAMHKQELELIMNMLFGKRSEK